MVAGIINIDFFYTPVRESNNFYAHIHYKITSFMELELLMY
jgi:hypothetical protein